jgi:SpoVK/Ycf46/Vps4 family AAA+-type ATPase
MKPAVVDFRSTAFPQSLQTLASEVSEKKGTRVLLVGASEGDKKKAAETIARHFQRTLHTIDLRRVMSKYIGETEKNLATIFSGADPRQLVLLFDEADALFGKRAEVKDAHDRYADPAMKYLLEQLASYTGIVVLATNDSKRIQDVLRGIDAIVRFS